MGTPIKGPYFERQSPISWLLAMTREFYEYIHDTALHIYRPIKRFNYAKTYSVTPETVQGESGQYGAKRTCTER